MDIVEFARDVLGLDLFPYQEELLRRAEAGESIGYRFKFKGKPKRILDEFAQFKKLGPVRWRTRKEAL